MASNHGLKKRALKKAATRAVVFLLTATQAKKIGPIVPRGRAGRPPDGHGLGWPEFSPNSARNSRPGMHGLKLAARRTQLATRGPQLASTLPSAPTRVSQSTLPRASRHPRDDKPAPPKPPAHL